jgi:hypothetical protein
MMKVPETFCILYIGKFNHRSVLWRWRGRKKGRKAGRKEERSMRVLICWDTVPGGLAYLVFAWLSPQR